MLPPPSRTARAVSSIWSRDSTVHGPAIKVNCSINIPVVLSLLKTVRKAPQCLALGLWEYPRHRGWGRDRAGRLAKSPGPGVRVEGPAGAGNVALVAHTRRLGCTRHSPRRQGLGHEFTQRGDEAL